LSIGVARNLSWRAQCWIYQNVSWGRIEAPRPPTGVGVGSGVPLPMGEAREGAVPYSENFLVFDLKLVNFGVF